MLNKKTVFLSGPMRGVPRDKSREWRINAENLLKDNFNTLHAFIGREKKETMLDPKGAIIRDKNYISSSNILLVNDTFSDVSMIGTSMEILISYQKDIPVIVFGDAHKGDYWMDYHLHIRVDSLEEACEVISNLFV